MFLSHPDTQVALFQVLVHSGTYKMKKSISNYVLLTFWILIKIYFWPVMSSILRDYKLSRYVWILTIFPSAVLEKLFLPSKENVFHLYSTSNPRCHLIVLDASIIPSHSWIFKSTCVFLLSLQHITQVSSFKVTNTPK